MKLSEATKIRALRYSCQPRHWDPTCTGIVGVKAPRMCMTQRGVTAEAHAKDSTHTRKTIYKASSRLTLVSKVSSISIKLKWLSEWLILKLKICLVVSAYYWSVVVYHAAWQRAPIIQTSRKANSRVQTNNEGLALHQPVWINKKRAKQAKAQPVNTVKRY